MRVVDHWLYGSVAKFYHEQSVVIFPIVVLIAPENVFACPSREDSNAVCKRGVMFNSHVVHMPKVGFLDSLRFVNRSRRVEISVKPL